MFRSVDAVLARQLAELSAVSLDEIVEARYAKFRSMGRLGQEFLNEARRNESAALRGARPPRPPTMKL